MGPPLRFHELQNAKVLLQFLEIRWSWHFKCWNSAVLKPAIIKWIVTSEWVQCSGVHCLVHHLNVHTVCDVIIARRCGTVPPFAAISLVLDCVVELWISLCLKAVMYISFRLGSDLEIRIQGKLCSGTTTFFFVLQSKWTKPSANHRWKLNQRCWF